MGAWTLQSAYDLPKVEALLNEVEEENASRQGFQPSISREAATALILAALGAYGARAGSTSSAYSWMNIWEAMRVDLPASKIVWLPDPATPTDKKTAGEGDAS